MNIVDQVSINKLNYTVLHHPTLNLYTLFDKYTPAIPKKHFLSNPVLVKGFLYSRTIDTASFTLATFKLLYFELLKKSLPKLL